MTRAAANRTDEVGTEAPEKELGLLAIRVGITLLMTVGCAIAVEVGWSSPIRTILALSFLLLGPGLAFAEVLGIRDFARRLAIAPAVSLGLETLLAITLVYAGAFSARTAIAILAGLTVAALAVALTRSVRFRRASSDSDPPA
jgi:uncharacterized membrane protein